MNEAEFDIARATCEYDEADRLFLKARMAASKSEFHRLQVDTGLYMASLELNRATQVLSAVKAHYGVDRESGNEGYTEASASQEDSFMTALSTPTQQPSDGLDLSPGSQSALAEPYMSQCRSATQMPTPSSQNQAASPNPSQSTRRSVTPVPFPSSQPVRRYAPVTPNKSTSTTPPAPFSPAPPVTPKVTPVPFPSSQPTRRYAPVTPSKSTSVTPPSPFSPAPPVTPKKKVTTFLSSPYPSRRHYVVTAGRRTGVYSSWYVTFDIFAIQ